jgi:glycosyltransferase involved in cell wall biosynthesis
MSSINQELGLAVSVPEEPSLGIVVCTYRREAVLIETLQQIFNQDPPADEVVVVDQTSEHLPETDAFLQACQRDGKLRWVRQKSPSLCAARNQGVLSSVSEVLLFLDDDVLLPRAIVERHKAVYRDASVAAITQDIAMDESFDRRNVVGAHPSPTADPRQVDYLRGFNFSVRRAAFIEASGFDEQFVGAVYRDEGDFAQRLIRCRRKIVADRRCNVVHLRAPIGGCRIAGNRSHAEWTTSMNFFLYGFRYGAIWTELWCALRVGPLRRENVLNPIRWPVAIAGFCRGALEGYRRAYSVVRSPFMDTRA